MFYHFIFIILYLSVANSSFEGESCIQEGVSGICTSVLKCPAAVQDIRNRKKPKICSFDGHDPVVCCVGSAATSETSTAALPGATPQPVPKQTTTKYIPPEHQYIDDSNGCKPLSINLTAQKTGQKAWDKCIEYQEKIVFPCEKSLILSGGMTRQHNCFQHAEELIVGPTVIRRGDFPHMALLGFGADSDSAQWLCSGTLLSEWFILTAAHCTFSRDYGPVTYAILGISKHPDSENSKVYKIRRIIRHPEFKPPSKYNDIALLQTEAEISLSPYMVPACLDVGKEPKYDRAFGTWWETLKYSGDSTKTLIKNTLVKFTDHVCSEKYPISRRMMHGFDTNTQTCYGDNSPSKDICQGDTGSPLEVRNKHVYCMHTVVGVNSFGSLCGLPSQDRVYTKVEPYVPWIESIVWP